MRKIFSVFATAAMAVALSASAIAAPDATTRAKNPGSAPSKAAKVSVVDTKSSARIDSRVMRTSRAAAMAESKSDFAYARAPKALKGFRPASLVPQGKKVAAKAPAAFPNLLVGQIYDPAAAAAETFENSLGNVSASATYSPLATGDEYNPSYGGFLFNDIYYCVNYTDILGIFTLIEQYAFNPETWEQVDYNSEGTLDMCGMGSAVDPTTGTLYRCVYTADGSALQLATYDPTTYTATPIAPVAEAYYGLGFASDGTLYGISETGNLDIIDKATGEVTTVLSDPNLSTYYITTGTVDPKTDTFYYFTQPEDDTKAAFYAVDLSTKSVEKLAQTDCEYAGMAVLAPLAEDGAPAAATNVSAEFTGDALTGVVKFTAPTTTFVGDALTGELTFKVLANGEQVATGTVNAGEEATVNVTVPAAGEYDFTVVTTNSVGDSPKSDKLSKWVGADAPNAPANVVLSYVSGELVLTWDAVTTTVHGGWMDQAALTYTVTRLVNGTPDGSLQSGITGTSYSVAFDAPEALTNISFEVVAVAGEAESAATESNPLSFGEIVPPYSNSFASENDLVGFTIIDGNEDGKVWTLNEKGMRMTYNSDVDMDDWLILPAVKLEAGKSYDFIIVAASQSKNYVEKFEVKMGTAPTAEAMTQTVIAPTELTTATDEEFSAALAPATTGVYYIGIHGISDADTYYLFVRSVNISAPYSAAAPEAVTDFKFIGSPSNGNEGTLSFNAPTKAVNGDALSTVDITVSSEGNVLKTFTGVAAGANVTLDVTSAEAADVEYTIVASNANGVGRTFVGTVFIGPRKAAAPTNAIVAETSTPGQVTVSWTPTLKDVDGNPLDAAAITYTLLDSDQKVVAADIPANAAGCEYTLTAATTQQAFVYYFVVPVTAAGQSTAAGTYALTDMIPVGPAYTLPLKESFANGKLSYIWMTSGDNGWTIASGSNTPACKPMDEDGGILAYNPSTKRDGSTAAFLSGKIDLSNADNKTVFKFYYFPTEGASYSIQPIVKIDGEEIPVGEAVISNASTTGDWTPIIVSLEEYAAENAQVGIRATCLTYDAVLCLDNLFIGNQLDNDLAVDKLVAPATVKAGSSILVSTTVANNGSNAAEAFSVSLTVNGEEFENVEETALASGALKVVTFEVPTDVFSPAELSLQAKVTTAADDDLTNNESDVVKVEVVQPELPVATDLHGNEVDGAIELAWTAPSTDSQPTLVEDGAEDYEDWAIDQAGDWTFVDGDGLEEYGWQSIEFPNMGAPSAFRIINATELGLDDVAHTGDKVFACFASAGGVNNDWMISPALAGEAQTLSFWARSMTVQYGAEEFEVMVSKTGTAPADFTAISGIVNPGEEWAEYTYELDADVKYFAIHCVSNDRFILLLDDFKFKANPGKVDLVGFNVYRNGVKINAEPVAEAAFTDTTVEPGATYDYYVTAVFAQGESALSNKWSVTVGIEAITVEQAADKTFYNLQGVRVNNPTAGRIYIMTDGTKARKVLVK